MRYLVIIPAAIFAMAVIPTSTDAQDDGSQSNLPERANTLAQPSDNSSQFYDGFESGYSAGYKGAAGLTSEPDTPTSPVPLMESPSDTTDDFEHGLAVGRIKGMMDGNKP